MWILTDISRDISEISCQTKYLCHVIHHPVFQSCFRKTITFNNIQDRKNFIYLIWLIWTPQFYSLADNIILLDICRVRIRRRSNYTICPRNGIYYYRKRTSLGLQYFLLFNRYFQKAFIVTVSIVTCPTSIQRGPYSPTILNKVLSLFLQDL